MKSRLCFSLFFSFLFFQASAVFANEVTGEPLLHLPGFYQEVLQHYPALKRQSANLGSALASKLEAYMQLMPRAAASSSVQTGDDPVYVFGSLLRQERFTSNNFSLSNLNTPRHYTNYHFEAGGEMPLFNAFQTISSIKIARSIVHSESLRTALVEKEAIVIASESYLSVLMTDHLSQVADSISSGAHYDLQQAEELKERGMVLGADFYAAKVTLGRIDQVKNQIGMDMNLGKIVMNILAGRNEVSSRFAVAGQIPEDSNPSYPVEHWRVQALEFRDDLKALKELVYAQEVDLFKARTSIFPRVSAFGQVAGDSHDLESGGDHFLMGVKGTIDFLDPFYFPRVKKAKNHLEKIKAEKEMLQDAIVQSVAEEALRYERLQKDLEITTENLADVQKAVEMIEPLYREGRKSIADLLEMRLAHLNTAIFYYRLRLDLELSYIKLLFLSGTLTPDSVNVLSSRLGD